MKRRLLEQRSEGSEHRQSGRAVLLVDAASSSETVNRMNDLRETLLRVSMAESRYQMIQTELRHLLLRSARVRRPEAIKRYEARIARLEAEAVLLFH